MTSTFEVELRKTESDLRAKLEAREKHYRERCRRENKPEPEISVLDGVLRDIAEMVGDRAVRVVKVFRSYPRARDATEENSRYLDLFMLELLKGHFKPKDSKDEVDYLAGRDIRAEVLETFEEADVACGEDEVDIFYLRGCNYILADQIVRTLWEANRAKSTIFITYSKLADNDKERFAMNELQLRGICKEFDTAYCHYLGTGHYFRLGARQVKEDSLPPLDPAPKVFLENLIPFFWKKEDHPNSFIEMKDADDLRYNLEKMQKELVDSGVFEDVVKKMKKVLDGRTHRRIKMLGIGNFFNGPTAQFEISALYQLALILLVKDHFQIKEITSQEPEASSFEKTFLNSFGIATPDYDDLLTPEEGLEENEVTFFYTFYSMQFMPNNIYWANRHQMRKIMILAYSKIFFGRCSREDGTLCANCEKNKENAFKRFSAIAAFLDNHVAEPVVVPEGQRHQMKRCFGLYNVHSIMSYAGDVLQGVSDEKPKYDTYIKSLECLGDAPSHPQPPPPALSTAAAEENVADGVKMPSSVPLSVSEKDVVKTILEFLDNRGLHIAQLALERETGVINGEFSDDSLFLRQLILDGQWDNALDFVQPLADVADFDLRTFRYHITKYKYYEILCLKQEKHHDNDFTVEELVECLKDLEHICPSPEDFRHLCALLTLQKLSDHAEFRYWNPSSARVECFKKVYPMVGPILASISTMRKSTDSAIQHAANDRLLQLVCKGTFYEACVDFCQAQALDDKKAIEEGPQFSKVLSVRPKIANSDLSLVSWIEVLRKEQFVAPFQQKSLDFKFISLRKPKLEAHWTEQIVATPIKPGGMFPHALVPNAKLKCVEQMSQSIAGFPMSSSYAMGTSISLGLTPRVRPHVMSHSTVAGVGFSIQENAISHESAMQQSQMIDNLFETSELTKSSRPGGPQQQIPISNHYLSQGPQAFTQSMVQPPSSLPPFEMSASRRQLEEISRRSQPRHTSLPPVPELSTPGGGGVSSGGEDSASLANHNMTRSRLFQEFATRQNIRQPGAMPSDFATPAAAQPVVFRGETEPPAADYAPRKNQMHQMYPQAPPPPQQMPLAASQSTSCIPTAQNPPHRDPYQRPYSQPPQPQAPSASRGLNVQFEAIAKYEDQQAIRTAAFHPSGRFFAVGTNSKQLLVCRYPDVRRISRKNGIPTTPEVVLNRPKQHRGSVYCLGFNPTGELLATGSNDKSLRLMAFNAEQCKIGAEMELNMHDGTVRDVIFMEDVLVSGGAGNCGICVTDCSSGQTVRTFGGHSAPILGLYTWGGSSFVSCSQDKTIRFWDLRSPNAINVVSPGPKTSSAPVTSVCVDPSGKLLVSGHEDASVMLYDVGGGRIVQQYRPHGDEVRTVRFSNAAYYLLSGSYDKRVVITDMRGDLTAPLMYLPVAEHNDKIIQCRWHPHDFTFLSTSADRSAVLWSLPTSPTFQ